MDSGGLIAYMVWCRRDFSKGINFLVTHTCSVAMKNGKVFVVILPGTVEI